MMLFFCRACGASNGQKTIHTRRLCAENMKAKMKSTYRLQMKPKHHTSLHISRCNQTLRRNYQERPVDFFSVLVMSQRSMLPRDYHERPGAFGTLSRNLLLAKALFCLFDAPLKPCTFEEQHALLVLRTDLRRLRHELLVPDVRVEVELGCQALQH